MIRRHFWLHYGKGASYEVRQSLAEGRNVAHLQDLAAAIDALPVDDPIRTPMTYAFWDAVDRLPGSSPAPSEWKEIAALCNIPPARQVRPAEDKVAGAWWGRIIGCQFGKPVEGRSAEDIKKKLSETDNYPMRGYIDLSFPGGALADDDTNYTVLGLMLLEKFGKDFTADDVAEQWLTYLPLFSVCTAELVAYRNILNKVMPPESAGYRNPFREWIGAQIRADIYGYVSPGAPGTAARMAQQDARLSHTANGIYGAMFVAATIAAAYEAENARTAIETGLRCIPAQSALYTALRETVGQFDAGMRLDEFITRLYEHYNPTDPFDWVHVVPNAMIVVASLLNANGDFTAAVGNAVQCGFDTDCNAATVGSIAGILCGEAAIPQELKKPLCGTLFTDIKGADRLKIEDLVHRTLALIDGKCEQK